MHAIFYAKGPDFKTNKTVKAFRNVSVYNLIAHILGLEIEVVDGNFIRNKRHAQGLTILLADFLIIKKVKPKFASHSFAYLYVPSAFHPSQTLWLSKSIYI
jgi:hypothetical protein